MRAVAYARVSTYSVLCVCECVFEHAEVVFTRGECIYLISESRYQLYFPSEGCSMHSLGVHGLRRPGAFPPNDCLGDGDQYMVHSSVV
jgi:hypothetical protein